jgi:hypothetical protein
MAGLGSRPSSSISTCRVVCVVDRQCFGWPARSIQRQHELAAQALSERVLVRQRLQLADQLGVPAEAKIDLQALLQRAQVDLLQARRRAAPQRLRRDAI